MYCDGCTNVGGLVKDIEEIGAELLKWFEIDFGDTHPVFAPKWEAKPMRKVMKGI